MAFKPVSSTHLHNSLSVGNHAQEGIPSSHPFPAHSLASQPHAKMGKARFLLSAVPLVLLASCDNEAAEPLSGLAGYPHKENSEGPVFNKERLSWAQEEQSLRSLGFPSLGPDGVISVLRGTQPEDVLWTVRKGSDEMCPRLEIHKFPFLVSCSFPTCPSHPKE